MVERAQALAGGVRAPSRPRLGPLAITVAGAAAFYLVLAWLRASEHGTQWFVHLGSRYLGSAQWLLGDLTPQSPAGYDGQYYYALAVDPAHAHATLGGRAGVVYSRPLYPLLARALALGHTGAIPSRMIELNLLAVVVATVAAALWLRSRGVSPVYALVFGLWPGLVFAVFRDLTEPLAFALAAVALLVFDPARPRRVAASAAVFALALLTRETVILFPLACAAALVLADRRWRRGAAFAAAGVLPLLAWRAVVAAWLHRPTQESGGGLEWLVPFHGLAVWPFDGQHRLILAAVVLPALALAAAVVATGTLRRRPVESCLLLANVLAFVVFLPAPVDVDFAAAARGAVGVALAAVYVLPGLLEDRRGRVWAPAGAALCSFGWYATVAAALGLPVLGLIST